MVIRIINRLLDHALWVVATCICIPCSPTTAMRLKMKIESSSCSNPPGRIAPWLEYHIWMMSAVLPTKSAKAPRYCSSGISCSPSLKSMTTWSLLEEMGQEIAWSKSTSHSVHRCTRTSSCHILESSRLCDQYSNAMHMATNSTTAF